MQEAIPYLKAVLQDTEHYDKEVVYLSLARLKVEPYYSDILAKYSSEEPITNKSPDREFDFRYKNLIYLGTQDAFYILRKWLFREDDVYLSSHSSATIPLKSYAALYIHFALESPEVKERFGTEEYVMADGFREEDVIFLRDWMEEHKGNIRFNGGYVKRIITSK